jgi:hypothetical protein
MIGAYNSVLVFLRKMFLEIANVTYKERNSLFKYLEKCNI